MIKQHPIPGEDDYRGGDGPLHVTRGRMENPLFKAFTDAGVEAGYPYTEDCNGYQQEGMLHSSGYIYFIYFVSVIQIMSIIHIWSDEIFRRLFLPFSLVSCIKTQTI